jgi:hypothetical protein
MDAHAGRSRIQHALKAVGTAVARDRVTVTPRRCPDGGGGHLLDDDLDEPLKL